jgi:hypothetical protein
LATRTLRTGDARSNNPEVVGEAVEIAALLPFQDKRRSPMKITRDQGSKSAAHHDADWVRFTCPAGHRLKADPRLAGQTAFCPRCGGQATIPQSAPNLLTDTGALRLLETAPPVRSSDEQNPPTRYCPRCGTSLTPSASLCGQCRLYLFPSEAWRSLYRSGGK